MRLALRIVAAIIGVVGAIVAFVVNLTVSGAHLAGLVRYQTHGFIGLLLVIVGLIGAFVGIPAPVTGAILMLIAGVGFIFIVHWWALVASPLLLLGAVLAYLDRKKETAQPA